MSIIETSFAYQTISPVIRFEIRMAKKAFADNKLDSIMGRYFSDGKKIRIFVIVYQPEQCN